MHVGVGLFLDAPATAANNVPVDMHDEQVWTAQIAVMQAALRQAGRPSVDAVFTSESYGDELAARFGAEHVCVDGPRGRVPVSGTAVRAPVRPTSIPNPSSNVIRGASAAIAVIPFD